MSGSPESLFPQLFFLGDWLSMSTPPALPPFLPSSLPYLCQPLPSISTSTSIHFHFLNVAICSVTRARLGREAVGRFHRTWSRSRRCEVTGQRWWWGGGWGGGNSGTGSSVTSGKRAGLLAAPAAPGVPGMYRRRNPRGRALNQCHLLKVTSYF